MKAFIAVLLLLLVLPAGGGEFATHVPIRTRGSSTYYVDGHIKGLGPLELMVDTGSGYSTINEDTLAVLMDKGQATFRKKLRGIMADGSRKVVEVYLVSGLNIGGECLIHDVEVAVFPAKTRPILGLNALRKVSPFVFSIDPPTLVLSHCQPAGVPDGGVRTSLSSRPVGGNDSDKAVALPALLKARGRTPDK